MITPEMTVLAAIKAEQVVFGCNHAGGNLLACIDCIEKMVVETLEDFHERSK